MVEVTEEWILVVEMVIVFVRLRTITETFNEDVIVCVAGKLGLVVTDEDCCVVNVRDALVGAEETDEVLVREPVKLDVVLTE